jgi:hypothetical protein
LRCVCVCVSCVCVQRGDVLLSWNK